MGSVDVPTELPPAGHACAVGTAAGGRNRQTLQRSPLWLPCGRPWSRHRACQHWSPVMQGEAVASSQMHPRRTQTARRGIPPERKELQSRIAKQAGPCRCKRGHPRRHDWQSRHRSSEERTNGQAVWCAQMRPWQTQSARPPLLWTLWSCWAPCWATARPTAPACCRSVVRPPGPGSRIQSVRFRVLPRHAPPSAALRPGSLAKACTAWQQLQPQHAAARTQGQHAEHASAETGIAGPCPRSTCGSDAA